MKIYTRGRGGDKYVSRVAGTYTYVNSNRIQKYSFPSCVSFKWFPGVMLRETLLLGQNHLQIYIIAQYASISTRTT